MFPLIMTISRAAAIPFSCGCTSRLQVFQIVLYSGRNVSGVSIPKRTVSCHAHDIIFDHDQHLMR
jgi:hypothetical protein